MFGYGGLALVWRQVLSLPTVHSILGVDSAEADKVGSRGFRFCAYADCALYRGVWHRRITPVRLLWASVIVAEMCTIAGSGSHLIDELSASPAASRSACGHHLLSGYGYLLT